MTLSAYHDNYIFFVYLPGYRIKLDCETKTVILKQEKID